MNRSMGIDHITLCVKDLHAAEYLFTKILGFEVIWSARDVGSEKSSMDTIVVQRGNAKVALMQGRDKAVKSQITEFIEKYGQGVQHVAIEVDDIEAVCREWEEQGREDMKGSLRLFCTCSTGDHGAFFELEAEGPERALAILPPRFRAGSRVYAGEALTI